MHIDGKRMEVKKKKMLTRTDKNVEREGERDGGEIERAERVNLIDLLILCPRLICHFSSCCV